MMSRQKSTASATHKVGEIRRTGFASVSAATNLLLHAATILSFTALVSLTFIGGYKPQLMRSTGYAVGIFQMNIRLTLLKGSALLVIVAGFFCCLIFAFGMHVRPSLPAHGPWQVHLALASSSSMVVSWQVRLPHKSYQPIVRYWSADEGEGNARESTNAKDCTYLLSGTHFHAEMTGLSSGKQYFYKVEGSDELYSFRAPAPDRDLQTDPIVIQILGDFGSAALGGAEETMDYLHRSANETDIIIHNGDIAYADDAPGHYVTTHLGWEHYDDVYDLFMQDLKGVFDKVPYMVSPGNHDAFCGSKRCARDQNYLNGLGNFTAYNCRWSMPNMPLSQRSHSMWYSFDYGPVHFVALNTETNFPGAPEEFSKYRQGKLWKSGSFAGDYLSWLEEDLRKADANRANVPWIVTYGHRYFFGVDEADCLTVAEKVDSLCTLIRPLLLQYADLVVMAHIHLYNRFAPAIQNERTPLFVTSGGAGCDLWLKHPDADNIGEAAPYHYLQVGSEQTVGKLTVTDKYRLEWTAHKSKSGDQVDKVVLTKDANNMSAIGISVGGS